MFAGNSDHNTPSRILVSEADGTPAVGIVPCRTSVFDGGAKRRRRKISEKASIRRPAAQVDEDSDSDSDVSCNYEVIDRCDNSRFAKYWSLIGSKFLDTADNINFNITAVCKCDGTYYFRYVREHVKHAKMSDFEYTPVSELLNADWYSPIDNSTDDGDNEAPRQSKKTRKY